MNFKTALAALMAALLLLAGCSQTPADNSRLNVVVSFYPMYDFASKIGGDLITIKTLVPAGGEPHDFEPSAADIKLLEQADVFIYNGVIETWAEDLLEGRQNSELISLMASEGIDRLTSEGELEGQFDSHEHDHHGGHHAHIDGHVWLDPENAASQAELICKALSLADPENSTVYEQNLAAFKSELDRLDQEYRAALAPHSGRVIVVSHESFGYLCRAYSIEQYGVEGLSPDSEPTPARMAEIIDFVRENNVTTIFFEQLISPRVAEAIASETRAKTAVLNSLEGLTQDQLDAGEDYFSIMRKNLQALTAAFEGE